uniref:Uncharacterized protein n=1 Tax=Octopus bimaculoides TaxID=37653 RepID=A0A0L8GN83_OCTBM
MFAEEIVTESQHHQFHLTNKLIIQPHTYKTWNGDRSWNVSLIVVTDEVSDTGYRVAPVFTKVLSVKYKWIFLKRKLFLQYFF